MNFNKNEKIAEVADEIYQYLCEHPKSADTIEGVTQWWLLHEQYLRQLKLVRKALEFLVKQGVIERRINFDGHVVFSLAATKNSIADKPDQNE